MPTPQEISIDAFNYDLPDERIAKFPKEKRDESKLLLYKNGAISETIFKEIYQHLPEKELLIEYGYPTQRFVISPKNQEDII